MYVFYHLVASLIFFAEDGFSRSLEDTQRSLNESGHDSVRMMMTSEGDQTKEFVSFESHEGGSKGPVDKLKGPNAFNFKFFTEIENEKILREIFLTCAARNNTIPFLTSKFGFDCYEIGERGPCSGKDEWLVITEEDEHSFPWSTCQKNRCHAFEGRIPFNDDCIETSASSWVCNKGMNIELNIHGQGICTCSEEFITIKDDQNFPHCYQEFLQGPCEEGEQLIRDELTQKPECIKTECQFLNQTKWSSGQCLESVSCGEDGIVVFQDGKLDCTIATRQLISVPSICGEGESKDGAGNCKEVHDNIGRSSRSPTGSKINFNKDTLKGLMCSKYPNKFDC